MGLYDLSLGTILIASWVNLLLVAYEVQQLFKYFSRYPDDSLWTRLPVFLAMVADTITTLAVCSLVYLYCITNWGDAHFVISTPWEQVPYFIGTGVSALTCQIFLTVRIYRLTRNPWWFAVFAPCIAAGLAGSICMAIFLSIYTTLQERYKVTLMVTLWTVSSAATDILLSVVFIYSLRQIKSEFGSTDGLIRKLSSQAIASGSISACVATLVFATFRAKPSANLGTMFGMILGRIYTLTMLYNLNSRASTLDHPTSLSPPNSRDLMDCLHLGGAGIIDDFTAAVLNETLHVRQGYSSDEAQLPSRPMSKISIPPEEQWELDQDISQAGLVVRYRV